MPGIFLYLLLVFEGPGRIVHALVSSQVRVPSRFHCWTEVDT